MKKETANIIFKGGENAELLSAIADLMDKTIIIHRSGQNSAADVVVCGDKHRVLSPVLANNCGKEWELTYSIGTDDKRVAWVFIGHKIAGPCYQCNSDGEWCNCYGHGNFGKNPSSGGNWSSAPGTPMYKTLRECVAGRAAEIKEGLEKNSIFIRYAVTPATEPTIE